MLTQAKLKEILEYCPETGLFTWLIKISKKNNVGGIAGSKTTKGYTQIIIFGKNYKASRLAFFYMTGKWPMDEMDHINRIRNDDRWINLRDVTAKENVANSTRYRSDNNTSSIVQSLMCFSS